MCAASVASTVVCHVGGRERAGESLDGGWDPSIVNGPRSAKKKFMDLLKKVQKVYGPPMHFTLKLIIDPIPFYRVSICMYIFEYLYIYVLCFELLDQSHQLRKFI